MEPRDGTVFLREQIAALGTLAIPNGVQPAVWTELKDSLRAQLQARLDSGKTALSVADSNASQSPLSLDTPNHLLSWQFYSQGDYDQNGEANVNDLTPLGQHFKASTGGTGPFGAASVESVIDGDDNGEVNVADLTPLGHNLGDQLQSYNVYMSTNPADVPTTNTGVNGAGAALVGTVPLSAAVGDPKQTRLSFSFDVGTVPAGAVFWVRPNDATDGSGADGTPSVPAGPGAPPTATVELFQLDIVLDGVTFPATDWGHADVSFVSRPEVLYFSLTYNGVEVLTDVPLLSPVGTDGQPRTVTIPFSLGIASGTPVAAGGMSHVLGLAPKESSSLRGTSAESTAAVGNRLVDQTPEGINTSPAAPGPAQNNLGRSPDEGEPVTNRASVSGFPPHLEIAPFEDTAAAIATSLQYLKDRDSSLAIGSEHGRGIEIADVRPILGEILEGTNYKGAEMDWPAGKAQFMQANGWPIETRITTDVDEAIAAMQSGCDVELYTHHRFEDDEGGIVEYHTSHFLTSLSRSANNAPMQYLEDQLPLQDGGVNEIVTNYPLSYFTTTGPGSRFVIECPKPPSGWQEQPIVDYAYSATLVELADGNIGMAYHHNVNDEQEFQFASVSYDGMNWTVETSMNVSAEPAKNFGLYNDVKADSAGNLHAAFSEEFPGYALWYATLPNGAPAWSPKRLVEDTTADVHGVSIVEDAGTPCVSYFKGSQLRYGRDDGAGGFTLVDPVSTSAFGNQLTKLIYTAGMPTILFVNGGNNLQCARADTVDGLGTWTDLGNVMADALNGLYLDADMVGGRCAAVVCTQTGGMLYCRAAADDCSSWDAPVDCSGGVSGACGPSLEMCTWEGFVVPCVSFMGGLDTNNRSFFIPALNSTGSAWPTLALDAGTAGPASVIQGQQTSLLKESTPLGRKLNFVARRVDGSNFYGYNP